MNNANKYFFLGVPSSCWTIAVGLTLYFGFCPPAPLSIEPSQIEEIQSIQLRDLAAECVAAKQKNFEGVFEGVKSLQR